jgi:hypothetical protein
MKTFEIIGEASIFTRKDKYSYGHKVRVGASSAKGKSLLTAIKKIVPDFDPSEDLEWIKSSPARTPKIQFGTGSVVRSFKRPNKTYIDIVGTDNSIQSGLVHAPGQKGSTEGNVGDLSEPVLSAAVVAKLIKRGSNSIEDITDKDVIDCLNKAISQGNSTYTVADKNSKIADIIKFTVAVREPTKVFMQSPSFWETYSPLLPSAVHYANSGQIDKYADYFYKNGKVDAIWVQSDGMSDQKGKKTDIEAFVRTANGEVRPLKNLKISLKAGSSQFGQQGAGSITSDVKSSKGIWQSTVNFFGPLGVTIDTPKRTPTTKVAFWTKAYKEATRQLKEQLAGFDARDEAGVISRIASVIVHHATKGDDTVRLVQLGKKGISTVHNFKGLMQKLVAGNIDLTVSYREGVSNNGEPRPEINIFDKNSGKSLVKMGYHATGDNKKIWNSITMEPLLSELTVMQAKTKLTPSLPPSNTTPTAVQPQQDQPQIIPQEPAEPDELDTVKKNAGIAT